MGRDLRLDEAALEGPGMAGVVGAVSRVTAALRGLPVSAAAVIEGRISRLLELTSQPDAGQVTWAGFGRDGRSTIKRAPLEVGPLLAEALFAERDSVILTGATLTLNGSFDYFRSRIGLSPSRLSELVLPSPFDFLNQALLCLPEYLPAPPEDGFTAQLAPSVPETSPPPSAPTLAPFPS